MKFNSFAKLSLYYLVITTVLAVLGIAASIYTYKTVARNTQEDLLKNVSSIASVFDISSIQALSGSEADLFNPAYIDLKAKLEKIPETNDDIVFIYLWGYRDDNPYFMADSEPADSEDYSPPGQVYDEATDLDRNLFLEKLPSAVEISTDRWGTWLSAFSTIFNEETGEVVAVMGVDMSADKYYKTVYISTFIPIITTLFVLLLLLTSFLLKKKEEEFLAFKSELVSIASHEIRSPLTGISWLAGGLLKAGENFSESQKNTIASVKRKSEELMITINDLLDSAGMERANKKLSDKKSISTKSLFEGIGENFHLNLEEKKIKLTLDPSIAPNSSISGDPERLGRMFSNIISNAIKYSKEGGEIVVSQREEGDKIIFSVQDEGIGIPTKDGEKVFKGFFRSENAHQVTKNGTGLGLYYVRQIVELHKGKVWYESEEGKGTTFYIELPKGPLN